MNAFLIGGAAVVGLFALYQLYRHGNPRRLARLLRWIVGGGLAALTAFLLLRGQVGLASVAGPFAYIILRYGRIGQLTFEGPGPSEGNRSRVKSRYITMTLDHDSGTVEGRVLSGAFAGADLMALGEDDTRRLLAEVSADPDSLALLETWLDKNRAGWREYFAQDEKPAGGSKPESAEDLDAEAYAILGLKPGATEEEIQAAHRRLIFGVHPDQGGSTFLAAEINAAKDRLLRKLKAGKR